MHVLSVGDTFKADHQLPRPTNIVSNFHTMSILTYRILKFIAYLMTTKLMPILLKMCSLTSSLTIPSNHLPNYRKWNSYNIMWMENNLCQGLWG
jgi:hypothetical protein